jgi:branched-chain amino acid transport system substrate-binding protein
MQRATAIFVAMSVLVVSPAYAEKKYGPGVSDIEIKLGQTMPYSGPASAYGADGLAELAYVKFVNDQGGVNGRKINLISLDDGYSPPKTVEQTRRLVEEDNVLAIFSPLGTAPNVAIQKYLNTKQVPHLFVASGASRWGDPEHFPWTMGFGPNYRSEAIIYAKSILRDQPNAKLGILYQNDDLGKDYLEGMRVGLGDKAGRMIVKEVSYEVTDPTVDSQIVTLKGAGADVFFNITTPKFGAIAIRKTYDIGWHPTQYLVNVASSTAAVLQPAGFEKAVGIISAAYLKDPNDPGVRSDPAYKAWLTWIDKYNPNANKGDYYNVLGYTFAQALVHVLKQCGDELTRENLMRQAASIKDLELPMLLPGIKVNTSPSNFYPIRQERLQRFNGERWELFGEIVGG